MTLFKGDKTKDGWKLISDIGDKKLENFMLKSFLKDGESYIEGEEMVRRAQTEGSDYGQPCAEYLLVHQYLIPTEYRKFDILFPGTIWRDDEGDLHIPYLGYYRLSYSIGSYIFASDHDACWQLNFRWLDLDWRTHHRFVCGEE